MTPGHWTEAVGDAVAFGRGASAETYAATAGISAADRAPANAGIDPAPSRTVEATVAAWAGAFGLPGVSDRHRLAGQPKPKGGPSVLEMFLRIDGIKGESRDAQHKDDVE